MSTSKWRSVRPDGPPWLGWVYAKNGEMEKGKELLIKCAKDVPDILRPFALSRRHSAFEWKQSVGQTQIESIYRSRI